MAKFHSLQRPALAFVAGVALLAAPLAGATAAPAAAGATGSIAPLLGSSTGALADAYIVVLKPGASSRVADSAEAATAAGATVTHQYTSALLGYSAHMPASVLAAVRANPAVSYVERDSMRFLLGSQTPATWGLDRVDQRNLPLNNTYNYNKTGAGVNLYMIDTGIRSTHTDFTGRVMPGHDSVGDGHGTEDCNGHGTHTSGTAGGTIYGVAKAVKIYPARVIGCGSSGPTSDILDGMDWVAANAVHPSVASMSIGGGISSALDTAANGIIDSGTVFVAAAGNDGGLACNTSPARTPRAITVAATDSTDTRPSFSNFGSCVDIFAPGVNVTSDWDTSDTATNTISGTSMATPHVSGAVCLYLESHPAATVAAATKYIIRKSTKGHVLNPGTGSPNRLLFTTPLA